MVSFAKETLFKMEFGDVETKTKNFVQNVNEFSDKPEVDAINTELRKARVSKKKSNVWRKVIRRYSHRPYVALQSSSISIGQGSNC